MTTLNAAEWLSAAFTAVIAVATIFYVTYTRRLWRETKASADAARASADAAKATADAAKQSADIAAEVQRPMLEVVRMGFAAPVNPPAGFNLLGQDLLNLQVIVRNYGTLWATNIVVDGRVYLNEQNEQLNRLSSTGPLEIAPGSVITVSFSVQMKFARLAQGAIYRVMLELTYHSSYGDKRYLYTTVHALNQANQQFTVEHNRTELLK